MVNDDFILLETEYPIKGKDIIGKTINDEKHFCFRCNCKNDNCIEWRCSITGYHLMVDIYKWKYVEKT